MATLKRNLDLILVLIITAIVTVAFIKASAHDRFPLQESPSAISLHNH